MHFFNTTCFNEHITWCCFTSRQLPRGGLRSRLLRQPADRLPMWVPGGLHGLALYAAGVHWGCHVHERWTLLVSYCQFVIVTHSTDNTLGELHRVCFWTICKHLFHVCFAVRVDVIVRLNTEVTTALSECPVAVKTLTVDMEPAALLAVSASRSVFYTRTFLPCASQLIRLFVAGNAEHNRLIMMLLFDVPLFNYCLV